MIFFIIPFNLKPRVIKILFHIHIYSCCCFKFIVWYTIQMALFLFCQIISYVVKTMTFDTKTLLKHRDQNFKICAFRQNFSRKSHHHFKLNFFKFLAFFPTVLVVSYLQTQQRKNSLNYRRFTKSYPCCIQSLKTIILWSRPEAFKTKTRSETFKTETHKNGSQDESQHSKWFQKSCLIYWLQKFTIAL